MRVVGWKDASSIITADGQVRAPVQYNGMVDAFRKTVKNEGPQALYKGLVPNSVKEFSCGWLEVAYTYLATIYL
jgi:solute carrier family 25 phosphate transporter 23/24/25/41